MVLVVLRGIQALLEGLGSVGFLCSAASESLIESERFVSKCDAKTAKKGHRTRAGLAGLSLSKAVPTLGLPCCISATCKRGLLYIFNPKATERKPQHGTRDAVKAWLFATLLWRPSRSSACPALAPPVRVLLFRHQMASDKMPARSADKTIERRRRLLMRTVAGTRAYVVG